MQTFFHSDLLHGFPNDQVYEGVIGRIQQLRLKSVDFYAGKSLTINGLNEFKAEIQKIKKKGVKIN
ncbi:MAG: hypothetical protein ACFFBC_00090 [Promethearchaeota archaeon]